MWKKNPEINLLSAKILEFSQKGADLFKNELEALYGSDSKEYHLKFFPILSEFIYFVLHIINNLSST